MRTFTITEWGRFSKEELKKSVEQFKGDKEDLADKIADEWFKELENFAKDERNESFLSFYKKDKLRVKNYVGIIQTKSGVLEILPKCFDFSNKGYEEIEIPKNAKDFLEKYYQIDGGMENINTDGIKERITEEKAREYTRNFLIHCLGALLNISFKNTDLASLDTAKIPLLEIFIQMFIQEFERICQRGIFHQYIEVEKNRNMLKGRLLFNQQLRFNLTHKERFYSLSDEYSIDNLLNAIIKTTLVFLKNKTSVISTKLHQAIEIFDEVSVLQHCKIDFSKCLYSRHYHYYENILKWCEVFLQNKSFITHSGDSKAYALLFPMERLFEAFVALMLKKQNKDYSIGIQVAKRSLIQWNNGPKFLLRPDLYIQKQKDKRKIKIIADTKWKILDPKDPKLGISQADLYQLFTYAKIYDVKEVWIFYPRIYQSKQKELQDFVKKMQGSEFQEEVEEKIKLKILFAPLALHKN